MKSMVAALSFTLMLFTLTSCKTKEQYLPNHPIDTYVEIISEDSQIIEIINDNTDLKQSIDICYPLYVFDLDVENELIGQRFFFPDDTIIFPVLNENNLVGFLLFAVNSQEIGDPQYMAISSEAGIELNRGKTIRIALAQWKIEDGHSEYANNYIYVSEDDISGDLFDNCSVSSLPKIKYDNVYNLTELNIDNLSIIKTIKNS